MSYYCSLFLTTLVMTLERTRFDCTRASCASVMQRACDKVRHTLCQLPTAAAAAAAGVAAARCVLAEARWSSCNSCTKRGAGIGSGSLCLQGQERERRRLCTDGA
jgi:hypothetical protein